MTLALVFPGQGSQAVGMGRVMADAFAEARHTFQEVDDALSFHLSKLIFEGPLEELTKTEHAQPAIMACALAVFRALEKQGGLSLKNDVSMVAGHSLGEYTALTAAGSFPVADAARLLRLRGQAMQAAVPAGLGMMAALIGGTEENAEALVKAASSGSELCQIANDNAPGQTVISGHGTAVERAMAMAKDHGFRMAKALQVSAPFHCSLMQPAAERMAEALSQQGITAPAVPLVANVTAEKTADPALIRELLVQQVTGRVRWRESVSFMAEAGIERFIEVGPGKVLTGLIKRIAPDASCASIETPQDMETVLATA